METLFACFDKMHYTACLSRPFLRTLLQKGVMILVPRLSYEVKNTDLDNFYELKIRICGNGSKMIEGIHFDDSYSPTCQGFLFRIAMGMAATFLMTLYFSDAPMLSRPM